MKKILIDLNVILDFLNKREGHEKAADILNMCSSGKAVGYICAHEITTLSYFLGKIIKEKTKRNKIINGILELLNIISIDKKILKEALLSKIDDYEDAVIDESAKKEKIEYIITRDLKDFKNASIKAITPEEYLTRSIS